MVWNLEILFASKCSNVWMTADCMIEILRTNFWLMIKMRCLPFSRCNPLPVLHCQQPAEAQLWHFYFICHFQTKYLQWWRKIWNKLISPKLLLHPRRTNFLTFSAKKCNLHLLYISSLERFDHFGDLNFYTKIRDTLRTYLRHSPHKCFIINAF